MVDALKRLDGHRPLSYEQLEELVRSQQEMINQYSPYSRAWPSTGALPRER